MRLIFAALGGYVTTFAFAPWDQWLLAPLGIALLVALVRHAALTSTRAAAGYGFIWGLAFFLPHLDWAEFAVGPAPWILLAASQGAFIALVIWISALLLRYRIVLLRLCWGSRCSSRSCVTRHLLPRERRPVTDSFGAWPSSCRIWTGPSSRSVPHPGFCWQPPRVPSSRSSSGLAPCSCATASSCCG